MTQQLDEAIFGDDRSGPGGTMGGAPPKPPRRTIQSLLALIVSLAVVIGGGYIGYSLIKPVLSNFTATDDYPGPGSGKTQIVITDGDSGQDIAALLVKADVIKTADAFISAISSKPDLAKAIQPGTYTMLKQMRGEDALAHLADPANRTVPRVTIREGLWASETFEKLSKATKVPIKDYQNAIKDPKSLGLPTIAKGNVEGWLFPSTYEFPAKMPAKAQLQAMIKQAVATMKASGVAEKNWEKTMILASIVESESAQEDRAKVARVFLNRLNTPGLPTNGRLESDATVSYGAKRRAVVPTAAELANDNPYNTRIHKGLPIGPISNPGKASIDAAAHPAPGPWFFFVTVNPITGETKFAVTLAEHNKNVLEFQKWCSDHKGQC